MTSKFIASLKLKDGRKVIFRYPTAKDAVLMLQYINTLSKEQTFIGFQGEQLTFEEEEKRVKEILEKIDNKKAVQILAFCNLELIAISDLIMSRREKVENHVGGFGITVAKDFRNLGIGKKLMQAVLNEATKNLSQLKIIILGVFGDNLVAQKLYEDLGFIKYGELPQGLIHKRHFDNYILMYKMVRDL